MSQSAEQQLCTAVVLEHDLEDALHVPADAFSDPRLGALWGVGVELAQAGKPRSLIALERGLKGAEISNGAELIMALADRYAVASARHLREAADAVLEGYRLRQLRALGGELADATRRPDVDALDLVREYTERLTALEGDASGDGVMHVTQVLGATVRDVERRRTGERVAISTGIQALDAALDGGLEPGAQYVVAARPGHGKTAFAMGLALEVARCGGAGLMFSAEMSAIQLGRRIFAHDGPVPLSNMKMPAHEHHWRRMSEVLGRLKSSAFWIRPGSISLRQVTAIARKWRRRHPKHRGALFLDYLQLVRSDTKARSREQEIAEISGTLKGLALDLELPTVVLSQLNRQLESRPDKRPHMSDLRESGAIEQDADVIMFLFRPWKYDTKEDSTKCEILIPKQREGTDNTTVLAKFLPENTRFTDWSPA